MGTRCARKYANILMVEFKERYIYSFIKHISILYPIFISNIFMVWTKSKNELKNFIKDLSTKHVSIKFCFKYCKDKIEFLGALAYRDHHHKL